MRGLLLWTVVLSMVVVAAGALGGCSEGGTVVFDDDAAATGMTDEMGGVTGLVVLDMGWRGPNEADLLGDVDAQGLDADFDEGGSWGMSGTVTLSRL